ncbi:MAG: hypothetical protein P8Z68_11270 [Kineosporiaceae bacterium]|jgi:hypothetical protein
MHGPVTSELSDTAVPRRARLAPESMDGAAVPDLFAPTHPIRAQRSYSPVSQPGGLPLNRIGGSTENQEWFTPGGGQTAEQRAVGTESGQSGQSGQSSQSGENPTGSYPRRRDLRRKGATGSLPRQDAAPAQDPVPGASFVRDAGAGTDADETDPSFPRRRDLRQPAPSEGKRERNSSVTANVARAAVLTMLVGAGYVAVSGPPVEVAGFNGGTDLFARSGSGDGKAAADAIAYTSDPDGYLAATGWDVRDELREAKEAGEKVDAARAEAARQAAAKAAAERAAAKAREEERLRAMRDAQRNPKAVARILAADRGWTGEQFTCLDLLWTRESNWNYRATNPSSGAYGIPQSLPGTKMASVGSDWRTNPVTQITWGLDYIKGRYGTPCGAWAHSQSTGWY